MAEEYLHGWSRRSRYMDGARRIHDWRLGRVHGWSRKSTYMAGAG